MSVSPVIATPGRRQENKVGCLMNVRVLGTLVCPRPGLRKLELKEKIR